MCKIDPAEMHEAKVPGSDPILKAQNPKIAPMGDENEKQRNGMKDLLSDNFDSFIFTPRISPATDLCRLSTIVTAITTFALLAEPITIPSQSEWMLKAVKRSDALWC
eukprot:GHVP01015798.1.p3 GENE.GHVP01015798.1~~GHVP01015798.1.p3  ORF type:complete len:107 (-),score=17.96 GHVP01015798.1:803-1123(-)